MFLRSELHPQSQEEEEEEELRDGFIDTTHQCPCCQEYIGYTDEVFLIQIVEGAQDDGRIVTQPLCGEDGDFLFEPYILHLQCWEEALEQMREATEDQPPVECENGILYCDCCKSTIAAFEPFVSAQIAEVYKSRRSPSGQEADTIQTFHPPDPICLPCVVHIYEEHFPDWEDLFHDFNIGTEEDDDES